ncbi:MAG: biopolymer transporter ExbD [Planctomycetota bacterium]|nr:MAG: biopolymer transporter ExbD [Planctomycetota bacterium]REJ88713.1 MAG: biopolymer transporter ExbD [Planctomycetota bacterium]
MENADMTIRRRASADKFELQVTPMIDIVFQLLVFFLLTFQISQAEGDFQLLMPRGSEKPRERIDVVPLLLNLRLHADAEGRLSAAFLNGERLGAEGESPLTALHRRVRQLYAGRENERGARRELEPGPSVVEIHADFELNYVHTIDAITAVRGYLRDVDGQAEIVTLIEQIRFGDPRRTSRQEQP